MRRWFAIFMLLLLTLQSTWAVAASYCQHEEAALKQHFGHHAQQHEGDADEGAAHAKLKAANVSDEDCGVCHAFCSLMVPGTGVLPAPRMATEQVAHHLGALDSGLPTRPERPNWPALA